MLIKNIKSLLQVRTADEPLRGKELAKLPRIDNAWIHIKDNLIHDFGSMDTCPTVSTWSKTIDAQGKYVLPTWVDSHTHLVFAETREEEFNMRIKGKTYEEIAEAGGGILNSAKKLRHTSEEDLFESARERLKHCISMGTGAIEIKSGYGLDPASEMKMLRVIKELKNVSPIPIKATFLGAHTYPEQFRNDHKTYVHQIVYDMIPQIAKEGLADYIDVFCERVAFSAEESQKIVEAGREHGLRAKVHTNQFNSMGGIEMAIKEGALSVDHLEVVNDAEAELLGKSDIISTLLPSAPFFLNDHYQPARKLIDAGAAVALASDYNPGSSPSGNMNFVVALACIKLGMTPEEAINAATINGAFALEMTNKVGEIEAGKLANLIITEEMPSMTYLPYSFGENNIEQVIINGKEHQHAP
ncbi:MAG: imidazolonepropionase [Flavobacteriales bacterium]|nr:imidazolonepropionase [Flavobacteriales bacterium]